MDTVPLAVSNGKVQSPVGKLTWNLGITIRYGNR